MGNRKLNSIDVRENDPEGNQIKSSNEGELKLTKIFQDFEKKKPVYRQGDQEWHFEIII